MRHIFKYSFKITKLNGYINVRNLNNVDISRYGFK